MAAWGLARAIARKFKQEGASVFAATKAGLNGLTRTIAVDDSAEGVRCNAMAPGWIDTDLAMEYIESFPDAAAFQRGIGRIHPVGRTGKLGRWQPSWPRWHPMKPVLSPAKHGLLMVVA